LKKKPPPKPQRLPAQRKFLQKRQAFPAMQAVFAGLSFLFHPVTQEYSPEKELCFPSQPQ
jgi:hypothetical protein